MSTAVDMAMKMAERNRRREMAARSFAMQITNMLQDYIAPRSRRDVEEWLAKAAYDNNFELTTLTMREEYEARGRLLLDIETTGQFSPQHKATPHG